MSRTALIVCATALVGLISLSACDGVGSNSPPYFLEPYPETEIVAGTEYRQVLRTADVDGDRLQVRLVDVPAWLELEHPSGDSLILVGTPRREDVGVYPMVLAIDDGTSESRFTSHISIALDVAGLYGADHIELPDGIEDSSCIYVWYGPYEMSIEPYGTASGHTSLYRYPASVTNSSYVVREDTLVVTSTFAGVSTHPNPTDYWLIGTDKLTLIEPEGYPLLGCDFYGEVELGVIEYY